MPALLLCVLEAQRRRSVAALAALLAVAIVAFSHMIWWVPVNHPRHSELRLDPLQLVYADAYVLIALCALALAAHGSLAARARGQRRRSSRLALTGVSRNVGTP
ncbi:MAG: hypothetical protein JWL67_38 [Solirubrobacterales bacterium]|nr:hypothetical protein [Solirubrobacterales bacterium]